MVTSLTILQTQELTAAVSGTALAIFLFTRELARMNALGLLKPALSKPVSEGEQSRR